MRALTPLEARVLGVLVEKQHTVPDTYPLSLNALVAGCNQKTARHPVIEATDAEVLSAIDGLKSLSLAFEGSSSRVVKFEHNAARGLNVPPPAAALLAVLMLRGPQTAAELRLNTERLHKFSDIAAVETVLEELADRYPPRAIKLPRAAGAREARWAQLLCGDVAPPEHIAPAGESSVGAVELVALKAELQRQGEELAALRGLVHRMAAELGLPVDAAATPGPGAP
ncbi:MAG: YceH family protein [Rubrivivax sp.]